MTPTGDASGTPAHAAIWARCRAGALVSGGRDARVPGGLYHRRRPEVRFWERLEFVRFFQLPADGEPGYVGLRRGSSELAVVASDWPRQNYGLEPGAGPRFEMYVYVEDVDALVADLCAEAVTVLKDPADMPWGERIASIADPDGNPVALASDPSR
jgi:lactoylglutathione lyase